MVGADVPDAWLPFQHRRRQDPVFALYPNVPFPGKAKQEWDAMMEVEDKRNSDMAREKHWWEKMARLEQKVAHERQHGYEKDWYLDEKYQGMDMIHREIARHDEFVSDKNGIEIFKLFAERFSQENRVAHGYCWHDGEEKNRQKKRQEEQQEFMRWKQQEIWRWQQEEEKNRVRWSAPNAGFVLGFVLGLLGLVWFLVRGAAWMVQSGAMTFWNRYQEYDVPATTRPEEQRADIDIINAQFQREMSGPQIQPYTSGGGSWTGSVYNLIFAIVNGLYRLVVALLYLLYQLLKKPLRSLWPFVRGNASSCLLFALFFLLVFNPWRPHPLRTAIQSHLAGAPIVAPAPPIASPPSRAFVEEVFFGGTFTQIVEGSSEWREVMEVMGRGEWP